MKKLITIGLVVLSMTATHAQWGKRIKGNGNVVTIERKTTDYRNLSVSGFFEITLVAGTEGELTLKGEDNLLENIVTEVRNGSLTIKPRKGVHLRPSRNQSVFITVPVERLDAIRHSGSGNLTGKTVLKNDYLDLKISGSSNIYLDIDADDVKIATSGSSNFKLEGTAKELQIRSSGSSNVKAYNLEVGHGKFELSGSSNVWVTLRETLTARVSGSGNIRYKGNPEKISSKISGSGRVSKVGNDKS